MKKRLIIFLIIILFLLTITVPKFKTNENYIELGNKKILIEIADSQAERERGLMFRENVCINCGMLFIFQDETSRTFWMKNTLIPLDMVFINSEKEIVNVVHATPCKEDPCKLYYSNEPATYVLETNTDLFNEEDIGKKIEINVVN